MPECIYWATSGHAKGHTVRCCSRLSHQRATSQATPLQQGHTAVGLGNTHNRRWGALVSFWQDQHAEEVLGVCRATGLPRQAEAAQRSQTPPPQPPRQASARSPQVQAAPHPSPCAAASMSTYSATAAPSPCGDLRTSRLCSQHVPCNDIPYCPCARSASTAPCAARSSSSLALAVSCDRCGRPSGAMARPPPGGEGDGPIMDSDVASSASVALRPARARGGG